ncbi:MAG: DUF6569 family protein [Terracidiphilus sp.]
MRPNGRLGMAAALLVALVAFGHRSGVQAAGGGAEPGGPYRVLAPIESGNLLLFPVVRTGGRTVEGTPFLTLDEGIKSGEVEVTEAGRAQGLVRPRGAQPPVHDDRFRGYPQPEPLPYRTDQVNTLVLMNHSDKPLLLLAGEIVTGGKQDRVIAKDRIVPAGAEPINLGVFCIEPGRWTGASSSFGAAAKAPAHSFMVQPTVRAKAMAAKDQQQVWDSVHSSIAQMEVAAAPAADASMGGGGGYSASTGTTSYAKVMADSSVSAKVDEAAAPVMQAREKVLGRLRNEHAVGVVVAVRGQIVWADLFASTDLLARYWTKLVRSYAAESLTAGEDHAAPTVADAERFLQAPSGGTETSEGEVGVYRYRELRSGGTETFVLESLLPGTGYDVHMSRMRLREAERRMRPMNFDVPPYNPPHVEPAPRMDPQPLIYR